MNEPSPAQPAPAVNPFSLVTALSDAFNYLFAGFQNFFRLSWKFLLFVVVMSAVFFTAIAMLARAQNDLGFYAVTGVAILLALLTSVAYYIVISRNWLLSETEPKILPVYPLFLFRAVMLTVILLAVMAAIFGPLLVAGIYALEYFDDPKNEISTAMIVFAIVAIVIVAIAAVVAGLFFAGRLIPWMVAAAVGRPLTLREAWNMTKGAGWRIVGGMFGLTLLFMLVDFSIESSLYPVLGIKSDAFENISLSDVSLPALFVLLLSKILIYFPQTAISMVFCASVYKQTLRG